jgi:hypothetical protein
MAEIGQDVGYNIRAESWDADPAEPATADAGNGQVEGVSLDAAAVADPSNGDPPAWMLWGVDEEA